MWIVPKELTVKFEWRFGWNNWTFGVWWGRFGKMHMATKQRPLRIGIDVGPLEMMWTKK